MPLLSTMPVDSSFVHSKLYTCPLCRGQLLRTWRRPVDRFTSFFMPVHRYRCEDFSCQWEGNVRTHANPGQKASDRTGERRHGLSAVVVAGILIVVVATFSITVFSVSDGWTTQGTSTSGL